MTEPGLASSAAESVSGFSQITVVGLGLLGGSFGLAIRQQLPNVEVVGVDTAQRCGAPAAQRCVHRCVPLEQSKLVTAAFAASDLVFLAAPIDGIQAWLPQALQYCLRVTDCGSTKLRIHEAAQRQGELARRFIGGHPMAGSSEGIEGARSNLFRDRPWVLCRGTSSPSLQAEIESLVVSVGARPLWLEPREHDEAVAITSHVPRLLSSAVAVAASRAGALSVAGPALERLIAGAGGGTRMWEAVLRSNAKPVAQVLRGLCARLDACAEELEGDDPELSQVVALLGEAEEVRRKLLAASQRAGGQPEAPRG